MPDAERRHRELRNRAKLALWLAVPFIALVLLVSLRGDFPLNDDWVYAKMVQALADRGHFGLSPLSNAYALTQTLYAAPLAKIFGFSFTLLRLTTIFMGWVTVCFTAFTARELGLSNRAAVLAALTVFVNPLFINLSYTFMTDVPFCAFATISTYYFVKALRWPTPANLLLGTLFSIAAFYNRQFGALIPIAFVLAVLTTQSRQYAWQSLARNAAVMVVPWVAALTALRRLPGPGLKIEVVSPLPALAQRAADLAIAAVPLCVYLAGLFLLPITIGIGVEKLCRRSKDVGWRVLILPIAALLAFFVSVPAGRYLEYGPPQILRFPVATGVGPMLFASLYGPNGAIAVVRSPSPFWVALATCIVAAVAVGIAASVVAGQFFARRRKPASRATGEFFLFLLAIAFAAAPAFAMPGPYYDRYLLPAIAPAAILLGRALPLLLRRQAAGAAAFVLAATLAYGVIGTQDYMAWNKARWQAIEVLRTKYHASDDEIDGGFEFNGMYTSDAYLQRLQDEPDVFIQKAWWVLGEKYRVLPVDPAHHDDSYEVLETVSYYSWLGFETRQMCLLRKVGAAE